MCVFFFLPRSGERKRKQYNFLALLWVNYCCYMVAGVSCRNDPLYLWRLAQKCSTEKNIHKEENFSADNRKISTERHCFYITLVRVNISLCNTKKIVIF